MKLTVLLFIPWLFSCTQEKKKEPIPTPKPILHDFTDLDFGRTKSLDKETIVFAPNLYSMKVLRNGSKGPVSYTRARVIQSDEQKTHISLQTHSMIVPTALLLPSMKAKGGPALFLQQNRLEYIFVEDEYSTILTTGEKIKTPDHVVLSPKEAGASIFCQDNAYRLLLNKSTMGYLTLSFPDKLEIADPKNCDILPLEPNIQIDQRVQVPVLGYYKEGTVLKVFPGLAEVQIVHANKKQIKKCPISQLKAP